MQLAEGFQREVGGVVLRVAAAAEGLGLQVEDADDSEDTAFTIDLLAERRFAGKEILRRVMAEDNDLGAALFF